jgi:isocitrate/isopropylmalate dehydrogenase
VGEGRAARKIEAAVERAVVERKVTRDLGGELSTRAVGEWMADAVAR